MTSHDYKKELKDLFNISTIKYIEDSNRKIIIGTNTYTDFSEYPQELRFKKPFNFNNLSNEWQIIWKSFGNNWNEERQLFRYFWDESRDFFQSYLLYIKNFEEFVPLGLDKNPDINNRMDILSLNCELTLRSMYECGKQAIDILQKINPKLLQPKELLFCNKFSETRNKFLTHYHNPSKYPDFIFDPVYFSIMGTGSLFEIRIHIPNKQERIFSAFINFRSDYFNLETILINTIKKISESKSNI